jgi:hypothetical protein
MLLMMPQDFPQNPPVNVSTEHVVVLAWPVERQAASSNETPYAGAVMFPAQTGQAPAAFGPSQETAWVAAMSTLTSALQELSASVQAFQPPPPRIGSSSPTQPSPRPEKFARAHRGSPHSHVPRHRTVDRGGGTTG